MPPTEQFNREAFMHEVMGWRDHMGNRTAAAVNQGVEDTCQRIVEVYEAYKGGISTLAEPRRTALQALQETALQLSKAIGDMLNGK